MDNLQARNGRVGCTGRFLHLFGPGFLQALAVALLAAGDMQRGDVVRHFQTKAQGALGHAIPAINGMPDRIARIMMPLEKTNRRPRSPKNDGRNPSSANCRHTRGKPAKLVCAEKTSTLKMLAMAME